MKIILADDHGLFRDSMATWLQQYPEHMDIEFASDWESLTTKLDSKLALIMLDLGMPGMTGPKRISELIKLLPTTPILVVSANDEPVTIGACFKSGASGYITKASDGCEILKAVTIVLNGGIYRPLMALKKTPSFPLPALSNKQLELLACLAKGTSNKEIALQLNLSEGTIKQYVSHLLTILNVDNRTQAGNKARKILSF